MESGGMRESLRREEPGRAHRAPGPAAPSGRCGDLLALQRAAGNHAVAGLLGGAVQRVPWKDTDVVDRGSLSKELREGLDLAMATPNARPAPLPPWAVLIVGEKRKEYKAPGGGYEADLVKEKAEFEKKSEDSWTKLGQKGQESWSNGKDPKKKGGKQGYFDAAWAKKEQSVKGGLDKKVEDIEKDFTWGADFGNKDGDLPGKKDAGGYGEYYAEPTPPHDSKTWGTNRVLHKTGVDGGHQGRWWVTDDHYKNYKQVNP